MSCSSVSEYDQWNTAGAARAHYRAWVFLTVHKVRWCHLKSTWGNYGRQLIPRQLCGWFCLLLSISCLVEDASRYVERTSLQSSAAKHFIIKSVWKLRWGRDTITLPYLALGKKRNNDIISWNKGLFALGCAILQIPVNCMVIQACFLINQFIQISMV